MKIWIGAITSAGISTYLWNLGVNDAVWLNVISGTIYLVSMFSILSLRMIINHLTKIGTPTSLNLHKHITEDLKLRDYLSLYNVSSSLLALMWILNFNNMYVPNILNLYLGLWVFYSVIEYNYYFVNNYEDELTREIGDD